MKFTLTFKNPDVLEQVELKGDEIENAMQVADKFIRWGEYVTIELDPETMTAKVLEVRK